MGNEYLIRASYNDKDLLFLSNSDFTVFRENSQYLYKNLVLTSQCYIMINNVILVANVIGWLNI